MNGALAYNGFNEYQNIFGHNQDKLRVVFYARVSTDDKEQLHSLMQQRDYFSEYIKSQSNWSYLGEYVDEGITGTSAKKRPQFMKMINDAKAKKFDVILTKEVSRFARNTVDTLHFTRELKKCGVCVIFTLDNINTSDKDGELRLTIMASLAQEEARKVSERVRWGHEKSMNRGMVYGNGSILGYDIVDGKLIINSSQAETVKLIYELYLNKGMGTRAIKKELEHRNISTPLGKKVWSHVTIKGILNNEKYIGNLIQKKFITIDYLDKKRKRNEGEEELIRLENTHEAIIDKVIFHRVQEEAKRRNDLLNIGNKSFKGKSTRYTNMYVYSHRILCGCCGSNYKRVIWNTHKDGTKTHAWLCTERSSNGKKHMLNEEEIGCNSVGIPEPILDEVVKKTIQKLWENKEKTLMEFEKAINRWAINDDFTNDVLDIKKTIYKLEKKVEQLIDMRTDGEINKEQFQKKKQEYDLFLDNQKKLLSNYDDKVKSVSNMKERLEGLRKFFQQSIDFTSNKIPDEIVNLMIGKIIVDGKNNFTIYLNSDLTYNVTYDKFNFELKEIQLAKELPSFSNDSMYRRKSKYSYN